MSRFNKNTKPPPMGFWSKAAAIAGGYYLLNEAIGWISEKSLKGDVAVVTGGGSGIGRLLCVELAKAGCEVAIWDINEAGANETRTMVEAAGGIARVYVANVTDAERVYALANQVEQDFKRPASLLINNAGIVSGGKPLLETPDAKIRLTFEVNTLAHFWTVKAFLPAMMEANKGHIVTIASASGMAGVPNLTDYAASKFAAVGFDESLRNELKKLGKKGVVTTCVCPYYINTGMFDGVTTKVPWLLPILKPENVVAKIMKAIKRNQSLLCLPPLIYTTQIMKGLLYLLPGPRTGDMLGDGVLTILGITDSMNEFKGRGK